MKTIIKIITLAVIITVGIFSCKKGDTGGKAEIHAKISHHSSPINASTVYVKFDTQEMPANPTSDYDLKVDGEATDNHVHIEDLRYGEYYLYAVGFDNAIGQTVKGGVPITIKWSE